MKRAVFLDRDGVLIRDVHLLTDPGDVVLLPGVTSALNRLRNAGFRLMVVSNQTVVARGLASEAEVGRMNALIGAMIVDSGGPALDAWYYCPHHPKATIARYLVACDCRKPRPGLLLRAAVEHGLDLGSSFMVGDRITDIIAGARAGCRTVLVKTGAHLAPPIETGDFLDLTIKADFECSGLPAATDWILKP
jgi:D-glycero-D-manno-heptose 1,7-bisphosphate phosphatase